MQIVSLQISNILSIEFATINFDKSGLVLVEGWNYDTERANGAGKSAIFNSLSFALFDKLPRKITKSELLSWGKKSGHAIVSLVSGKDEWTIKRFRPNGVEYFKNGSKVNITQEEFESSIKMTYDQFTLSMYSPQSHSSQFSRFLTCSDSDKKSFILQLLNLDRFSILKKAVDDNIKQLEFNRNNLVMSLSSSMSKIEAFLESKLDEDDIEQQILALEQSKVASNKEIIDLQKVEKPDLSKIMKLESDLNKKLMDIARAKANREHKFDSYEKLQLELNTSCSKCGSSLPEDKLKAAKINRDQESNKLKSDIDELDLLISKEKEISDMLSKISKKKISDSKNFDTATQRINELNSFIKTQSFKVNSLKEKLTSSKEVSNKVDTLRKLCESYKQKIELLDGEININKTLSNIYSPTGAQAYVLDSVVDSFNEIVQSYIDKMSPNMTYSLNSYKENSKGDVVAKFSESLVKNGIEVSIGSLSGGELRGLSLCVDFALIDILEKQFSINLNPIILDEPFDGLDFRGREIVISLLEQIAANRQILVVDHASEAKALFSKTILVQLRNGVSSVSIET